MWGSWLGALISFAIGGIYIITRRFQFDLVATISVIPLLPISYPYNIITKLDLGVISGMLGGLIIIIYGFLIGWAIHSLIRSLK